MKKAMTAILLLLGITLILAVPQGITNIGALSETCEWTFNTAGCFPKHLPDDYYGTIVLGDIDLGNTPNEVQGIYWHDGAAWLFWAPGAPGCTLSTMGGGHTFDYLVCVTGPCKWEVPISAVPNLSELQIHFIDVGQGDAILVDLGDSEVIIDGGGRSPGVTSYLEDHVNGNLEGLIATHPHADHIGGLIDVLENFDVEDIWLNGDTSTSITYSDFMTKVNAEGAEVNLARRGDAIVVDGLIFNVLHPITPLVSDINNNSIVLMMSYGDIDFLFTGDAEEEAESSMIAAGILADIEILKVSHHGSRSSSSLAFLAIVRPEVAIYMAGEGNLYGHPHPETIQALEDIGADIYGTDVCGTITVTTDGTGYKVSKCTP